MPSLLQLSRDEQSLLQAIYDADGEITDEQVVLLENLSKDLTHKTDNCVGFIRATEHEIEGLRRTEAELAARRKRLEYALQSFRNYALSVLGADGVKRGETGVLRWRWATKRKLVIDDPNPENFPEPFRKLVPARVELDTDALREHLESHANGKRDAVILYREGTEDPLAHLDPPTAWLEAR